MADKWLVVSVAGLGWRDLEERKLKRIAGLDFAPIQTVFPAVTCTVQASFRTASHPKDHGMTSNGVFNRALRKAAFWEQSSGLVQGPRIWVSARSAGAKVAIMFWQQSLGEDADCIISPAPIHKHGGGTIMENYVKPDELGPAIQQKCGTFPLGRYWEPLASPKIGNAVVDTLEASLESISPEIIFLYLPTLDYDLQRFGPADERRGRSFALLEKQLGRLSAIAERMDYRMLVFGDYAIAPVDAPPAFPNVTLRKAGFLNTRHVRSMAYPDLFSSRAFAMADHEIAHVYVRDPADISAVRDTLAATCDYDAVETKTADGDWCHDTAGEILLTAKKGSWCVYKWWTNDSEAPDYATHIDIHSKPGYDPCELFFNSRFSLKTCLDATRIRGTHGRVSTSAFASSATLKDLGSNPTLISLASSIAKEF